MAWVVATVGLGMRMAMAIETTPAVMLITYPVVEQVVTRGTAGTVVLVISTASLIQAVQVLVVLTAYDPLGRVVATR